VGRCGPRPTPHPPPPVCPTGSPGSYAGTCRFDSSLGMLTKKFINLIERAPGGVLDLNQAADALQVGGRLWGRPAW